MKEFKKWWKKDSMEGDWDYERYAERGWEAALEWVLKNRKPYYDIEDKKVVATNSDIIYEELEQ